MIRIDPIAPAKLAAAPDFCCLIAATAATAFMLSLAVLLGSIA